MTQDEINKEEQEDNEEEKVFLILLIILLILLLIKFGITVYYLCKQNKQEPEPEPVLAVVLVDAIIVHNDQEQYLTGYRIEYHKSDVSNVAKTPDINAELKFAHYLKYTYTITNYTQSEMLYYVQVEKNYKENNLKLSYSLNDSSEESFENDYIAGQIAKGEKISINLFVKIVDNLIDADLSGNFSLNLTYFADDSETTEGENNGTI